MVHNEDSDNAGGYEGSATVMLAEHEPVVVEVILAGHFNPIAGKYEWAGRIRGLSEALGTQPTAKSLIEITTPHGSGVAELSAVDLFGGYTVRGLGVPPFQQLPTDVPR